MHEVFAIEIVVKASIGAVLLLAPMSINKILGLPRTETGFWPRLLGATLIGLAAACYMEARLPGAKGLALAGAIIINVLAAGLIAALLLLGRTGAKARGKLVLWSAVVLLLSISAAALPYA